MEDACVLLCGGSVMGCPGVPHNATLGRRRLFTVVCVVSLCHPLNLIRQRLEEKAAFPTVASHGTKQERASSLPLTWGADKQQKQHEAVCLLSLCLVTAEALLV